MISVAEAQAAVRGRVRPLAPSAVALEEALGRVLADNVASDLDMPPFDKALMDGYAVRSADFAPVPPSSLTVIEEVMAGQVPQQPIGAGQATRLMTGASLPAGSDAVVMQERVTEVAPGTIRTDAPVRPGQNVLGRAAEMRKGEVVLNRGTVLRPQEIAVLAAVGRACVQVTRAPRVAIVATGDELVEPTTFPGPGQIRNSNSALLIAQVQRAGGQPRYLGIARDSVESLRERIGEGLGDDVLLISGGVSAGARDLVPGVLGDLGVEGAFHKVAMKPGKPVFFGQRGGTLVFGLPGNPVSALVCFELFVRPALRLLAGHTEAGPRMLKATLAEDCRNRSDRPTYHPAMIEESGNGRLVRAVAWQGSADLRSMLAANSLLLLEPGAGHYEAGSRQWVISLED